ncbi:MAG: sodium-dependent bicarbonate transport family permease [Rhabdochlamydiaceae bacterium]|nr:sodium-dependent bicarbonate transport family permease [Rhabdochlamydiaceae bacterium]
MDILNILFSNLIAIPVIFFLLGILFSIFRINWLFRPKIHSLLTYFLLFSIGVKGGGAFMQHLTNDFFLLLGVILAWGLIQPFISYGILRKFTKTDAATATAIAACFGSVSVMTFVAATAFLEKLQVPYQTLVIAVLAMMEVPAILSGLFISKWKKESVVDNTKNLWIHTLFNKSILMIFLGMAIGMICYRLQLSYVPAGILMIFKPCLCLFLLNMGLLIGKQRKDLNQFSWSLTLFAFYTPLIGGAFGMALSYLFGLDVGTGTLIAVLIASASYIAVPAAVRIAIPAAKEALYIPLALGIAFPFNVLIGIPIYYFSALKLLS